jgi:selenocysteine lyase/cysteine desulfurase
VLSDAVRAAYADYLRDWDSQGAPWEYWMERTETARASFAGLIGAHDDEIAVTASVSAGVNAIASGLPKGQGRDRIVVSDFEFPTVGQIWHAQEARGYAITHVPQGNAPVVPLEAFDDAIDERTALVAITQVCYRNGACIDIEGVVRLAHERGALVLLDSYQAVGSMPIDVHALGVDLLVAGALKYLLASAGLGFLYCRRELFEQLRPTATGWFADADVFAMDIQDYSPAPDARRFQAGTPPIPSIYAGIAGIELMKEIGVGATRAHVSQLNEALCAGIDELGGTIVTPRDPASHGALVAIRSTDEHALVAALAEDGILTSSRDGNLRVSAHCYNTHEDIDVLLEGLKRHRALLAA